TIIAAVATAMQPDDLVTIGHPIANVHLYILDPQGRQVPIGVAGELHIGGVGLARGYLHREALTAARFIADPTGLEPGGRLYRTGDLARFRTDGRIGFLGRIDDQVKIRGYRIELGEVETVLAAHPAVAAAVVTRHGPPESARLVAYVVLRPGHALDRTALVAHLGGRLPAFMLPGAIVSLPALPYSPNDKIDRRALPSPTAADWLKH
ncbi:MAG: AMP-binding protein, partial [Candidatus Sericytochromatia bacterium]|nr:AMP-binding protein [Candidatus Sericytochromatia bacterium]